MSNKKDLGAIILAAGKGERMQLDDISKVTLPLGEKPMISHVVHFIKNIGISTIVVVVGHYKQSVVKALAVEKIIFAQQLMQLGTGHALICGVEKLPKNITDVMVVYGDDAVLYTEKNISAIHKLFKLHEKNKNAITFLTIEQNNPFGLGRIVRDKRDRLLTIVEEKDATDNEKKINEINPGCFIFSVNFLQKYLPLVEKSKVTGEYYLTSLIDLAIKNQEKVDTLMAGNITWRGVNTKEELEEAEKLFKN